VLDCPARAALRRFGAPVTKWRAARGRGYDPPALPSYATAHVRRGALAPLGLCVALVAAVGLLLAAAPPALADAITPESGGGSDNAERIDTLYKLVLYIAIVIFLIVEGTLIYSLVKFRARRGGPEAAQIRGNTPLELGWTVGAALILVVLTVVTFIYLDDIEDPPRSGPNGLDLAEGVEVASIKQQAPPGGRSLNIEVNGQQYLWRYDYPGREQLFSYHELVVPINTTVTLDVTASDVIHSWWIPELGGKVDAVPDHKNQTWFKISDPGVYEGQCAELCGAGHADMRAVVRALPVDEYEGWAERQRADIQDAQQKLAEQRRFREQAERQAAR
jgi:cytochrome c oxidase subunit 2